MADSIDEAIGRRLMRRRRLLGLTQQQVGVAVGVRFQQIQKYECGQNRVSAARLYLLSQALDVPVEYFFSDVSKPAAERPSDRLADGSAETKRLTVALSGMEPKPRRHLLRLAQSLAE